MGLSLIGSTTQIWEKLTVAIVKSLYECMVILDSGKIGGDLAKTVESILGLIKRNHGEVITHRVWDERKFTFPIRKQKKGIYYLFYFSMPTSGIVGLEGDFRINEFILRHMVTKITPKLSEAILAVGRDSNAFCFQSVTEPPEEDLFDNDRDRDRDRNRRRRPAPETARSEG